MNITEAKVKDVVIDLLEENDAAYEFLFNSLAKYSKELLEELVRIKPTENTTQLEEKRIVDYEFYNKLRILLYALRDERISNVVKHIEYYEQQIENNNKFLKKLKEE